MGDSEVQRLAEICEAIHTVLYSDWNPSGVSGFGPDDKWNEYNEAVYRILATSRSEEALIDYLRKETEEFGTGVAPREHFRPIAQKLLAVDVGL